MKVGIDVSLFSLILRELSRRESCIECHHPF